MNSIRNGLLLLILLFIVIFNACINKTLDLEKEYGKYSYSIIDSTGTEISSNGIFHTVWKKQPDGSWKYVWD